MKRLHLTIVTICFTFLNLYSQNEQKDIIFKPLNDSIFKIEYIDSKFDERKELINMLHQNTFADFILKIEEKKKELKLTRIGETNRYKIPEKDIKEYVELFDRLQCIHKHFTVQCLYIKQPLGGQPYLVASDSLIDSIDFSDPFSFETYEWINKNAANNFMKPCEDTEMAYFQYLIFSIYGEQFALHWHALYNDKKVLLIHPAKDKSTLFKIWHTDYSVVNKPLNLETLEHGMLPIVSMDDNYCYITLFEENYENIKQITYLIQKKNPWEISQVHENIIIKKEHSIDF